MISLPHQTFSWLQTTGGQNAENAVVKLIATTISSDGAATKGFAAADVKRHTRTGGIAAGMLVE